MNPSAPPSTHIVVLVLGHLVLNPNVMPAHAGADAASAYTASIARELIRNVPVYAGNKRCVATGDQELDKKVSLTEEPCSDRTSFRTKHPVVLIWPELIAETRSAALHLQAAGIEVQLTSNRSRANVTIEPLAGMATRAEDGSLKQVAQFVMSPGISVPSLRELAKNNVIRFGTEDRLANYGDALRGYNIVRPNGDIVSTKCLVVPIAENTATEMQILECIMRSFGIYKQISCQQLSYNAIQRSSMFCMRPEYFSYDWDGQLSVFDRSMIRSQLRRAQ